MDPREVPVLVLGFNRPELLGDLLRGLREVKPRYLYVAIDGPRLDYHEQSLVQDCREQIDIVDWPCRLRTRFQETNLGCGNHVASSLDWFFQQEEFGIILEDDIRPNPSFFPFMAEMLNRYRNDDRVFAVSGTNFVPGSEVGTPGPYRFSRIPVVWGWGTWRRAWDSYAFDIRAWWRNWPLKEAKQAAGGTWSSLVFWSMMFNLVAAHRIDTWDFQAVYSAMRSGRLVVVPNVNLVDNVGFDQNATHTDRRPRQLLAATEMVAGVSTLLPVDADDRADRFHNRVIYGAHPLGLLKLASRPLTRAVQRVLAHLR